MFIPQPNISTYRRQYANHNQQAQLILTLCNENIRNQRMIGSHRATVAGIHDEGAAYRGYGCYSNNGVSACPCCNIYCPIYYNTKNAALGRNGWFVSNTSIGSQQRT